MTRSTLFFQNITAIDHAIIHPGTETIQGGSYNLSVWVTGNIEEQEQVVVDFSTLKKSIKSYIDSKFGGFDHKLWVSQDLIQQSQSIKNSVYIETDDFSCLVPQFTIKVIDFELGIEDTIEQYLIENVGEIYPEADLEFKVFLSEEMNCPYGTGAPAYPFRYVHGLKNSTSEPCQNINHGHLSYMGLIDCGGNSLSIPDEAPFLTQYENVIFIWKENIIKNSKDWLTVGYSAPTGTFFARYRKNAHDLVILPCETTVENLAGWIKSRHEDSLDKTGAEILMVSEGLAKGAVVYL